MTLPFFVLISATTSVAIGQLLEVRLGRFHACALGHDLHCWGDGGKGEHGLEHNRIIGDAAIEMGQNLSSVNLGNGKTPIQVATRYKHTCVILNDLSIKCWGKGKDLGYHWRPGVVTEWQSLSETEKWVGDSAQEMGDYLPALDLGADSFALQITVGRHHSCALLNDRSIKCWGSCFSGECGQENSNNIVYTDQLGDSLHPVDLGNGSTAMQVEASWKNTCALLVDGSVKCWGYGGHCNGQESLDNIGEIANQMGDYLPAIDLGARRFAVSIALGDALACALLDSGSVKCWGETSSGNLGQEAQSNIGHFPGQMGDNLPAINLGLGSIAKQISAGVFHTCAILEDSSVKCWGFNGYGRLGVESTNSLGDHAGEMGDNLPKVDLGRMTTAKQISAGYRNTCVVTHDNTVKCWGAGGYGITGSAEAIGDASGEMGDNLLGIPLNVLGDLAVSPAIAQDVVTMQGSLLIRMSNATNFVQESVANYAMRRALAEMLEVYIGWVQGVTLAVVDDNDSPHNRRLSPLSVQVDLENDVRIEFVVHVPASDQPAHVVATVIAETFETKTVAEATDIINSVMTSDLFDEDYEVHVVFKAVEIQATSAQPSDAADPGAIIAVSIVGLTCLICSCIVAVWLVPRQLRKNNNSFNRFPIEDDSCSLLDLLTPPNAISAMERSRMRLLTSRLMGKNEEEEFDVFICYALNHRATDVGETGPGMYYAVAVLKVLVGQGLRCMIPLAGITDRKAFLELLSGPAARGKVMLVVETRALFDSRECLENIHVALENSMDIKRLRFDGDVPDADLRWPQIASGDVDGVRMFRAVETRYFTIPTLPLAPACVLDDAQWLVNIAVQLNSGVSFEPRKSYSDRSSAGSHTSEKCRFVLSQSLESERFNYATTCPVYPSSNVAIGKYASTEPPTETTSHARKTLRRKSETRSTKAHPIICKTTSHKSHATIQRTELPSHLDIHTTKKAMKVPKERNTQEMAVACTHSSSIGLESSAAKRKSMRLTKAKGAKVSLASKAHPLRQSPPEKNEM